MATGMHHVMTQRFPSSPAATDATDRCGQGLRIGGWRSSRMVAHYAVGVAAEQGAVAKYL